MKLYCRVQVSIVLYHRYYVGPHLYATSSAGEQRLSLRAAYETPIHRAKHWSQSSRWSYLDRHPLVSFHSLRWATYTYVILRKAYVVAEPPLVLPSLLVRDMAIRQSGLRLTGATSSVL